MSQRFSFLRPLTLGLALFSTPCLAQSSSEPPASPFDFAFGGKIQTDYVSRGYTQTNGGISGTLYGEGRYNLRDDLQIYAGTQVWNVKLPSDPLGELDLYAGLRPTFGAFSLDVGAIAYVYPGNITQYWTQGVVGGQTISRAQALPLASSLAQICSTTGYCATAALNSSYYEFYAKPSYALNDSFSVGGNLFYSPNWNRTGAHDLYVSGTAKYAFGSTGISVSGEIGRQFFGSLKAGTLFNAGPAAVKIPNYTTWNIGASYNYKIFTFDLRYSDSTLNKKTCYAVTGDPSGNSLSAPATLTSRQCGARIVGSLSFDLQASKDLK